MNNDREPFALGGCPKNRTVSKGRTPAIGLNTFAYSHQSGRCLQKYTFASVQRRNARREIDGLQNQESLGRKHFMSRMARVLVRRSSKKKNHRHRKIPSVCPSQMCQTRSRERRFCPIPNGSTPHRSVERDVQSVVAATSRSTVRRHRSVKQPLVTGRSGAPSSGRRLDRSSWRRYCCAVPRKDGAVRGLTRSS